MNLNQIFILLLLISLLLLIILSSNKTSLEYYGWSCTYTPNKDYYKEDWILGNNPTGLALARDSIKLY